MDTTTTKQPERRTRGATLSRQSIVDATLHLLQTDGADALTTRRIAEECGVRGPSLYWHFTDRAELLDGVVDEALSHVRLADYAADWEAFVKDAARSYRKVLRSYRGLSSLLIGRQPLGPHALDLTERVVAELTAVGFPPGSALAAFAVVTTFTSSAVMLEEASPEDRDIPGEEDRADDITTRAMPVIAAHPNRYPAILRAAPSLSDLTRDQLFEFGLAAMVGGLATQVETR